MNPSVPADDPTQHLEFLVHEDPGVVRAAMQNGVPSRRGAASIDVCALNRVGLVQARQERISRVRFACLTARDTYEELQGDPNNPRLQAKHARSLAEIDSLLGDEQPYLALTRRVVELEFPGARKW